MKTLIIITLLISSFNIQSSAQSLWGMTADGGGSGMQGTIFRINEDGTNFNSVYSFNSTNPSGHWPGASLLFYNNKFYGMTSIGGLHHEGIIFSYDSATNIFTDLHDFDETDGDDPVNSLIAVNNGLLYGVTTEGGAAGQGVLFSFNIVTNTLIVLHSFVDSTGYNPRGNLLMLNNGNFYGTTYRGGGYGGGVVFKFDTTNSTYTVVHNCNFSPDGNRSEGSLILANNGLLYGMTTQGGIDNGGAIFSINPANDSYSIVYNFTYGDETPYGSLIQASNGLLYGMTHGGGVNDEGYIFSFNTSNNSVMELADFNSSFTGEYPYGDLIEGSNGILFGMTSQGGGVGGFGTVFSFDTTTHIITNLQTFTGTNGDQPLGNLIVFQTCSAPNLIVNNNQHICIGNSITLTVSGANSYTWQSNSSTDSSITVTPIVTTSYIVTGSNGNCSRTDTIVVTVTSSLTPAIIGASSVCAGNSITLDAGSFSFYSWSNGSTLETITINSANTYTVTVTDNSGCTGTASQSVTVNPLPTPAITGGNSFCSGDSTTLTVNSYSHYHWNTGAANPSITVTASGTYIVTVTDNNGCTGTASQAITVNQLPVPLITGDTSFCSGSSSTLNAGSFAHYIWSTGSTAQTITVDSATTYHITVTDANGCTGIASRTITVYSLPHPVITSNGSDTFCQGNSVMLTVGIYPGYLWNTAATTPSITAIDSTTYIVTVTNANGCTGTASRTITVHASPSPTISGGNTICSGDSLILNVGSFAHYLWNNGITTQSINATASGNYSITVTNSGGCTGIASESVSVTANPVPVIAPASPINLCEGENVTLHASNGILYNWSNGATTQYLDVSASGAYSVTVTYGVNCSNTSAPTDVIVHPLPIATIAALPENLEFCIGDSILLTANSSTSPITYLWNQGSTTQSIEATQSGDFTVTVTDTIGCHSSSSINLTSYLYPVANFTYSMFLNTTTFTNTSTNGTAYQWYFGDGNVSTLMNPTHTYSHDSTYTITLIVTNPCGADTVRYTITLTGINEINRSDKFIIYPNPANSTITLHIPMSIVSCQLSIENVLGEEIYKGTLSGIDNSINVLDWSEGVYFITIRSQETISTQKFIKL